MAIEQSATHQSGQLQDGGFRGGSTPASKEEVAALTQLFRQVLRHMTPTEAELPPEVKRDVDAVAVIVESIQNAVALKPRAMAVTELCPAHGAVGTVVSIHGKRFVPGSTVIFGEKLAADVTFVCQTELEVTAPEGKGCVDVIVSSIAGTARLQNGFSYDSKAR